MSIPCFNPASEKPEMERETVTTDTPEVVSPSADNSKDQPKKKKGWSTPWAGLEFKDPTGADKFDEDRYTKYYNDYLAEYSITEIAGKAYVARELCELNGKQVTFASIAERFGYSRENAIKHYNKAKKKIDDYNKSKGERQSYRSPAR